MCRRFVRNRCGLRSVPDVRGRADECLCRAAAGVGLSHPRYLKRISSSAVLFLAAIACSTDPDPPISNDATVTISDASVRDGVADAADGSGALDAPDASDAELS